MISKKYASIIEEFGKLILAAVGFLCLGKRRRR